MNKKTISCFAICIMTMGVITLAASGIGSKRNSADEVSQIAQDQAAAKVEATVTGQPQGNTGYISGRVAKSLDRSLRLLPGDGRIQIIEGDVEPVIPEQDITEQNITEEPKKLTPEEQAKLDKEDAIQALGIQNPDLSVSAKSAVLFDVTNQEVLYHKNSLKKIAPASTTKLLTAIVALDYCSPNEKVKVGSEIDMIAWNSSRAYLQKGQVLTLSNLLDAMLLPSGNDAAYVTAVHVGRVIADDSKLSKEKAVKLFVNAMNRKIKSLHCVNSHFLSPDGYDCDGQYTTAYDMGIIAMDCLHYDAIRKAAAKSYASDKFVTGQERTWINTNKLVKKNSGFYYEYAIGLKTGTTDRAGKCLISAAKKGDKEYVSVVMNASLEGRWQDSIDLLKYGVGHKK